MKRSLISAIGYCALTVAAHAADISGTYVGTAPNSSVMLQLVQSQGGNVLGRFEQFYVAPRGTQVQIINGTVNGAAGGHTVVLQIKLAEAFGGTIPASGDLDGNTMDLSGGRMGANFDFHLVRSSAAAFQSQLRRLDTLASAQAQMQAEAATAKKQLKQMQERRDNVVSATHELRQFDDQVPAIIVTIRAITKTFSQYTTIMRGKLAKEGEVYNGAGSFPRNQIAFEINDIGFRAQDQRYALNDQEMSMHYAHGQIPQPSTQGEVGRATRFCTEPAQMRTASCADFAASLASYRETVDKLEDVFAKAEAAWSTEHAAQREIKVQAFDLAGLSR